jgi:hypothetical protein
MGFERRADPGVTDRGQHWLVACRSEAQRSHMHPKATFQMIFGVISAGEILTGSQLTGTLESNSAPSVNLTKRVVDSFSGVFDATSRLRLGRTAMD